MRSGSDQAAFASPMAALFWLLSSIRREVLGTALVTLVLAVSALGAIHMVFPSWRTQLPFDQLLFLIPLAATVWLFPRKLEGLARVERQFWTLCSVAIGLDLIIGIVWILFPDWDESLSGYLFADSAYVGSYLLILLAIELRPHLSLDHGIRIIR